MLCPKCQSDSNARDRFCAQCGHRLPVVCSGCEAELDPAAVFCGACGTPTGVAAQPRAKPTNGKLAERKNVTVLFADLVSSLSLLEEDPEQAAELLETTLGRLSGIVRRHGGTVTQAMGDGIMAVFGAPFASEDHAFDACRAALAVHEERPPGLAFRVGICSGLLVMTRGGADADFDYSAFGRSAHVAARLQGLAEPGQTLFAQSTWRQVDRRVSCEPMGRHDIRGLDRPIDLYRLTGISDTPYQTRRVREALPIFGRECERARLETVATAAETGTGATVALSGTAGVGKSRLTEDFAERRQQEGWRTLRAFGVVQAERKPYAGVAQVLADCLFARGAQPNRGDLRATIAERLAELDCATDETLRAIASLYGIEDAGWADIPPAARRAELGRAVMTVIAAQSRRLPLLIALDDLQWIDPYSQDLFADLAGEVTGLRVVILANYRLGTPLNWAGLRNAVPIRLEPLSGQGAEHFLDALLGRDPSLGDLRDRLLARTRGVPFFLEEFVREMRDAGSLSGRTGDYRLRRGLDTLDLPLTVHDVVATRIDRLRGPEKRLLRAAAALGQKAEIAVLSGIDAAQVASFETAFENLVEAEFLASDPEAPDFYVFRHPVTHEVTYRSLVSQERRALHAAALEALKANFPEGGAGVDERLGFQAENAGLKVEAAGYLVSAGARVLSGSAVEHAIWCFEKAARLLADAPEDRRTRTLEIDALLKLRNALLPVGRHDEIPRHMERAWSLCRDPEDEGRRIRISSNLCHYFWLAGQLETSLGHGLRALSAAERRGEDALIVPTRTVLGFALHSMGRYGAAVEVLGRNAESLVGPRAAERFGFLSLPSVVSRGYLAWALAEQGSFDAAYPSALAAREIADDVGRPFDRVQGCLALSHVLLLAGRAEAALDHLSTADRICRDAKVALLMPRVAALLGYAHALIGDLPAALAHADRALERVEAINLVAMRTPCLVWAGGVQLMAGRGAQALDTATRLRRSCRASGEAGYGAWAQYLYATALFETTQSPRALPAIAAAGKRASALGMRPLRAHTLRAEGKMRTTLGQAEEGRILLDRAQESYRLLSMEYWINDAILGNTSAL